MPAALPHERMENMEKKFWWFSKKNDPASEFDEINNDYYGEDMSSDRDSASENGYDYQDSDSSDVSVVLSGDPSKDVKEPLMKRTFTPLTCNDSSEIVDAFKDGRVAVICIEELDKPNFLRLFDYIMGAVQALDGEFERIDRDTVVLFPYGVDVETDIDELEEEIVEESDEDGESEDENDSEDLD
jgi:FtsZ-interacting cell division protein YlmF